MRIEKHSLSTGTRLLHQRVSGAGTHRHRHEIAGLRNENLSCMLPGSKVEIMPEHPPLQGAKRRMHACRLRPELSLCSKRLRRDTAGRGGRILPEELTGKWYPAWESRRFLPVLQGGAHIRALRQKAQIYASAVRTIEEAAYALQFEIEFAVIY